MAAGGTTGDGSDRSVMQNGEKTDTQPTKSLKSATKPQGQKSGLESGPKSGGMIFGDGKHRAKALEQFQKLAGDNEAIPLKHLQEQLKKQRSTLEMTDAQIEECLKMADKNGDAMIDFREFESLMASPLAKSTKMQQAMRYLADGVIAKNQRLEVHSYLDAYNCFPPPIFIMTATFFQIAVFLGYFYDDTQTEHTIMTHCAGCFVRDKETGERSPGPLLFVPLNRHEVWRFWSYQWLHAGINHLGGNVVMQCLLGIPLEIVHKIWRIGPLYTLAVISGALLQYSLDPTTSLVGCSGGVYALITAHLANVFMNWSEIPFRWVRLGIIGVFLGYDVGMVVYRRAIVGECDTVSHAAHIGGAITGFCFGIVILHNLVKRKWEEIVRYICIGLYIAFFIILAIIAAAMPPTTKPAWKCKKD